MIRGLAGLKFIGLAGWRLGLSSDSISFLGTSIFALKAFS